MAVDLSQFYQTFFDEASEHLHTMETMLLNLSMEDPSLDDLNAIFRAAHSVKGGSGTFGFTDMAEVTHVLESLLDRLRKEELRLTAEMVNAFLAAGDVLRAQLEHHQGGPEADPAEIASVCASLALLAAVTEAMEPAQEQAQAEPSPAEVAASEAAANAEAYGFFDEVPGLPVSEFQSSPEDAEGAYGLFGDAPGVLEHLANRNILPSDSPAAVEGPGYGIFLDAPGGVGVFADSPGSDALFGSGSNHATRTAQTAGNSTVGTGNTGAKAAGATALGAQSTSATPRAAAPADTSIRVAVEKVDQLINLVGELVIIQAMLAETASHLDPVQAEGLLAGIDMMARNTRDMQESVMSIRMLPMSTVFSRFPRVVRDLAGKLNKQVEMKTVGETTELDKGLIEKISDPLTHLVRNSLDHGIETPEKRIAAGKNPKGTLTLKASHQGGNIVIEVMDDGGGLNRARILEKAKEKGLPSSESMSDHEVWQLIFAPGFSTADVVTDVSGRGVGMDVVKRNIEGMGGRVELESSPGYGTRTVIRLPLTLAILDGMSVGVGGDTYILPITSVVESLQPKVDNIHSMAGDSRMIHIRGEYLPFVSLAEVFNLQGVTEVTRGIVVVVEIDNGKAALFVDELLGQHQVVIKSLESNYRKVPGVSGATIMGDGRVAMILDLTAITKMGLANPTRKVS